MNIAVTQAKSAAKQLRARLAQLNVKVSHSQSLEAAAAALSGKDWNRYLAQAKAHPESSPSVPFLLAQPGDGGWMILRAHDLVRMEEHPTATAVWCYPDQLDPAVLPNPGGLHVYRTWTQMQSHDPAQAKDLALQCQGKVLFIHAPANFGDPQECLGAVQAMAALLKAHPVMAQALEVSWLDMHRWTQAPAAGKFLETLGRWSVRHRFHSQVATDIDAAAAHFPIKALAPMPLTQAKLLTHLQDNASALENPVEVEVCGSAQPVALARLSTLAGCAAYISRRIRGIGGTSKTKGHHPAEARIDRYIAEETGLWQAYIAKPQV